MLKRALFVALIALTCSAWSSTASGAPEEPTPDVTGYNDTVTLSVTSQSAASGGGGSGSAPVCRDLDGTVVACVSDYGPWSNQAHCYYQLVDPDFEGEIAREGQRLAQCQRDNVMPRFLWVSDGAAAPPDPEVLIQQATAQMQLAPITIGTYPRTLAHGEDERGVVNYNMWMWVEDPTANTWGPISRTVTLGGYSLTATARVTGVTWDMGNGDIVECKKGSKWTKNRFNQNRESPTCGYVYPATGEYPITATSHWQITWNGLGQSGSFTMDLASTETMQVVALVTLQCAGNLEDC